MFANYTRDLYGVCGPTGPQGMSLTGPTGSTDPSGIRGPTGYTGPQGPAAESDGSMVIIDSAVDPESTNAVSSAAVATYTADFLRLSNGGHVSGQLLCDGGINVTGATVFNGSAPLLVMNSGLKLDRGTIYFTNAAQQTVLSKTNQGFNETFTTAPMMWVSITNSSWGESCTTQTTAVTASSFTVWIYQHEARGTQTYQVNYLAIGQ